MWRASVAFTGVVGGAEVQYQPGDIIPEKAAQELGLTAKADLATKEAASAKPAKA